MNDENARSGIYRSVLGWAPIAGVALGGALLVGSMKDIGTPQLSHSEISEQKEELDGERISYTGKIVNYSITPLIQGNKEYHRVKVTLRAEGEDSRKGVSARSDLYDTDIGEIIRIEGVLKKHKNLGSLVEAEGKFLSELPKGVGIMDLISMEGDEINYVNDQGKEERLYGLD